MILIGLGANLASEKYGSPEQTLEAAIAAMPNHGISVLKKSRWHQTEPVPKSDQPMFTNGVIAVETALNPYELLDALRKIETEFGRVRNGVKNEARIIDLDLLTYDHQMINDPPILEIPHPRMLERPFVMQPLLEVTLEWRLAG